MSALFYAVFLGSNDFLEFLHLLLRKGADINMKDHNGDTALHSMFHSKFMLEYYKEKIKYLIDQKVDVSVKNNEDKTVLELARTHGDDEIIQLLEKAGAID